MVLGLLRVTLGRSGQHRAARSPRHPMGGRGTHYPGPGKDRAASGTMADSCPLLRSGTLAPVPERRYCRPGCFTMRKRRKFPSSLNSQRWVFVREGLDDFRKGCPPREGLIAPGPKEAFPPMIYHGVLPPPSRKRQNELPKEAALLSRLSWAQRARKAFVEDLEARLALHPLALHPHLEEAMPAQLLLQVLEVLDPERKLEDTWAYCQDPKKRTKEPTKHFKKRSTQVRLGLPKKTPVSHSNQWLYEKKPSKMDVLHEDGLLHENIRKEVSDFCNWATTLGSSNIEEEFILKQFDVGYQSKPTCDVLHVMRLNQIPLELKKSVEINKLQEADFFQKLDHERKHWKPQNPYKPKQVKMRYGAWYLNTNLWKKQRADEPLVDPKVSCKSWDENFKKKVQEQEELLADLHGIDTFKDFILSRGYRMPRCLEKMYIGKKSKCVHNKTPIKLT
ncbi:protein FAM47E isoform X2 [Sciurus carolinensis]|uniref:protein FAM47E isoform X2 n=1 Tax=Sciurus carolinensis TaxID=30640 RepID=UPI001FB1C06D|nr:protein FAM47E isoform X2 [Sciurus carolinensis]